MSSPIAIIVKEVTDMVKFMDRNILALLYNTWIKNILLIVFALYCIFGVKHVPSKILELTNKVPFRIAVAVVIVYISRRHIDLAVLMILAFYFTLRESRGIRVMDNGELEVVRESEVVPATEEVVEMTPPHEEEAVDMPFHRSKNPEDVRHPAHIREDMAVFDEDNMNTCVAVSERDMCAGGLFSPSGYIADDFNNLADF